MPKITDLISFEGTLSNSDVFPVVNSSVTKKIPMSAVRANVLTSGSVSSTMLQVDSVTTTRLANASVTEPKIADGAVVNAKLGNGAVNAIKIADNTITTAKYVNASVTEDKIAADAVTTSKLLDLSVSTNKLAALAVSTEKLADSSVTTAKLANNSVTVAKLASDAVFPAGTRLIFQQTNAPTGWVKITDLNDRALRVVSGNASTGGSTGFSSVFTSKVPSGSVSVSVSGPVTVTGYAAGHVLTAAQSGLPDHTHPQNMGGQRHRNQDNGHGMSGGPTPAGFDTAGVSGGARNAQEAHSHSWVQTGGSFSGSGSGSVSMNAMDFAVAYVDVIVAQKS